MDGKDGKDEEKAMTEAIKDPTYFFPQDLIVMKVENTLFRIHLSQLLKHSEHFRDLFNSPSPLSAEGFSETEPFVVDDITAQEFRHFLRIIYPSVTMTVDLETFWTNKLHTTVSKDEWISVLKVSTLWRCLGLRKLAIREIQSKLWSSQATEKIALGRKYSVSTWVELGYRGVVGNRSISDEQMELIGVLESFQLLRITLENQKGTFSLDKKIRETFQAELRSIAAAEEALQPTE